ncbi:MAG: DUF2262 domain-containing protein [Candidatus Lokiarchaeota archaeon]|nr:DUF2262 domain-containing protein [Candidatus Lokiarchaeota archaeon]
MNINDFRRSFKFDEKSSEYRLWIKHESGIQNKIIFSIDAEGLDENEINKLLELVFKFYEKLDSWIVDSKEFAVSELLDIKNKSWLAKGEERVSEDEFKSRMSLINVAFFEDGYMAFFDAKDMFTEHAIIINGDFDKGFSDCYL